MSIEHTRPRRAFGAASVGMDNIILYYPIGENVPNSRRATIYRRRFESVRI